MKGGKEWALVPLVLALASALLVLPVWLQGGTQVCRNNKVCTLRQFGTIKFVH